MLMWTIRRRDGEPAAAADQSCGEWLRFVVHRHVDRGGAHIDLRIERPGGVLAGWRLPVDVFDRLAADETVVCTLKPEHPIRWLDHDSAEYTLVDTGVYRETRLDDENVRLTFRGRVLEGDLEFRREHSENLLAGIVETMRETADGPLNMETVLDIVDAARDGRVARARAVERVCGLGRELDGDAFDEPLFRRMLDPLSLADIYRHMAKLERRFDQKYPPQPVTRRTSESEEDASRRQTVRSILNECV